jgi:hypothetical protein
MVGLLVHWMLVELGALRPDCRQLAGETESPELRILAVNGTLPPLPRPAGQNGASSRSGSGSGSGSGSECRERVPGARAGVGVGAGAGAGAVALPGAAAGA